MRKIALNAVANCSASQGDFAHPTGTRHRASPNSAARFRLAIMDTLSRYSRVRAGSSAIWRRAFPNSIPFDSRLRLLRIDWL